MAGFRLCPPHPLEQFAGRVIQAMGADHDVAAEVAHHLVRANLSGHDSHGMLRVAQYVAQADGGGLRPAARPRVVRETAVAALIDAERGFGHFSTVFALEWALGRACEHGLAAAAVRHSTHIGRLGEYTERAADRGCIAIVTVGNAGPRGGQVLPQGGRDRFLGTNPWSIGVPAAGRPAMILDMATSMIARGKVHFARAKGTPLPPGCIVDNDGQPSTDPEDLFAEGALLPVGGPVAGHKGYGLGLASALLGGLAMIDAAGPDAEATRGQLGGVFLTVIDPAAFGEGERYQSLVGATLTAAGRTRPAPGADSVLVPGEPEVRAREERTREGVALPEATWDELAALAARFDLPLPENRVA